MLAEQYLAKLREGAGKEFFGWLYGGGDEQYQTQRERYANAIVRFEELFPGNRKIEMFSSCGRTEVGGNHTDHQHGRVLAAGVNLDVIAAASKNDLNRITIQSEGHQMDVIDLNQLEPLPDEQNRAAALIRGVAARMKELGYNIGGFDAYTTSNVLKGSGLSSSAAFEILVCTILSHFYNEGSLDRVENAKISQYAENVYFGKPSGLMDQTASSVGGFVTIDFEDVEKPVVEQVPFDFGSCGHALCIVDTKGSHSDLTPDYAAVPAEMKSVAKYLGREFLRETDSREFFRQIKEIREACSDRAVLRAIHFYEENDRVPRLVDALKSGNFERFKELIIESGRSSYMYLQNVYSPSHPGEQGVSVALALCEKLLAGKGAWRVHGGGFAGTIQAFVPNELLEQFRAELEAAMGEGTCHILKIRPVGSVKVEL